MASTELNIRTKGVGDKYLILLHPYPVNGHFFDELELELPMGWQVMIPDLPGFGNSGNPLGDVGYSLDAIADLIIGMLPDEMEELVILGVSMGGYVTMALTRKFAEKISGLILMNTRDQSDGDGGAGRLEVVNLIKEGKREQYINNLFPKLLGKTNLQNDRITAKTRKLIEKTTDQAIILSSLAMGKRKDSRSVMESLDVPILLITGEEDVITGEEIMEDMAKRYNNSELVVIPQSGHYAALEKPQEVSNEIAKFLLKFQG